MFGYIRPCRPELKLKEDALFRAYYCGVCKSLGRRSGPLCRALLRYDLAFLALVQDGVRDDAHLETRRCPLKGNKLNMMQGESVSFAADAHLLLSFGKLRDDQRDGRALAALGGAALGPAVKRVAALHPALEREMEEMLRAQAALEEAGCKEPDDAAEPFAQFLSALFAAGMPEDAQPSLRYMGRNMGKWIYWLDALDDYDKDAKKGAYNVWRAAGFSRAEACRWALPILMQCICQARLAYDVLDAEKTGALVLNVLNEGMPRVMDAVAEGRRLDDGSI
jgi:hypothetical protein